MNAPREKYHIQNSRLAPAEIPGLRHRVKSGVTTARQEADRYGVGVETIRKAVRGDTFRNIREFLPAEPTVPPAYGRRASDDLTSGEPTEEEIAASLQRLKGLQTPDEPPSETMIKELLSQRTKDQK